MKNNCILRFVHPLWLLTLMFLFNGCIEEDFKPSTSDVPSIMPIYSYNWTKKNDADTLIFECNQRISYSLDNSNTILTPKAMVKLYPSKDTVFFEANEKPDVVYKNNATKEEYSKNIPSVNKIEKDFYFTDGQIVKAEIYYEKYNIALENDTYELPCVIVDDVSFVKADFDKYSNDENIYIANLDFSFDWYIRSENEVSSENISTFYTKKMLYGEDELLDVSYATGYTWHNGSQFSLFVEKKEIWRDSGEDKITYHSPVLDFYIIGKEDKSLTVDNLDFQTTESSNLSEATEINSDNWNILKNIKYITVVHNNGFQSFSNEFEFPVFEVSLSLDGELFNFDLKQQCKIKSDIVSEDEKNTLNTNAYVSILNRQFDASVYTNLELKNDGNGTPPAVEPNPDPTPNPDPDPEPEKYKYGKIVSYSVTATYDVNASFSDGNITKKCVMIRFEHGYLWGICEYNEDFPVDFHYTTAGYSGFNSVIRREVSAPFELARAVDIPEGIVWYSENNKMIAGIDVLSCKILGWKNVVNGKYSAFINSYTAKYSDNNYTITLTSSNGVAKSFYSE